MNGLKPISPKEVETEWKNRLIPDGVISAFNTLIQKNWKGGPKAVVTQKDVIEQILINCGGTRQEIFDNKWLDVEPRYIAMGWKVTYEKSVGDDYRSQFIFEPSPKNNGNFDGY